MHITETISFSLPGTEAPQVYQFKLISPYREGHVLTESEARALSSAWAKNLQGVMRKVLLEEFAIAAGEEISDAQIEAFAAKLEAFAHGYRFEPRHHNGALLMKELRAAAEDRLRRELAQENRDLDEQSEEFRFRVLKLMTLPEIKQRAIERTEAKVSAAAKALEDLL
jgi:hypothetical protein